jgi:DNA-binding NarL/FixJ family response regulator
MYGIGRSWKGRPMGEEIRASLTAREQKVLSLVAQGKSNREIAALMPCSLQTVDTMVRRIKRKTGLRSRAELKSFAEQEER